jgi:uncharacterized membrane protein YccC
MKAASANSLALLKRFQWTRGARASVVVGTSLFTAHALGLPPAAIALGAFNPLLVDNGGPYRMRLTTMLTTIVGGSISYMAGALVPPHIGIIVAVTMVAAFGITFARLVSQQMTSSSVLILVLYFAGLGGTLHTFATASYAALFVIVGGLWAVLASLVLWPIDSFRPARQGVADCYQFMAEFTANLAQAEAASVSEADQADPGFTWRFQQRARIEQARATLAGTASRAPSRTIRFRNLTVLLETSDMLLARTMRLSELKASAARLSLAPSLRLAGEIAQWLANAEAQIASALVRRPADVAAAFARDGSLRLQFVTRRKEKLAKLQVPFHDPLFAHLLREERDALLELETAFDAIRALWTGNEPPASNFASPWGRDETPRWLDALHANWTMESAALRHALRTMIVGGVDVTVMHAININHGFWLPMTSIILLQPFSAGTVRKSVQRVTGTIAGGIFAAILAAAIANPLLMLGLITVLAGFTVATFAVDYAIFCLFLTPTFVLLGLRHPHDWQYALIRIGTTLAGALIAVLAMRLLWPERAEVELGHLLQRCSAAAAGYLKALLDFWQLDLREPATRLAAERRLLAPARRACGLASNDAEEAVDRVLQEPSLGCPTEAETILRTESLTFVTYLRRLTQTITTLALVGRDSPEARARLAPIAARLERLANASVAAPATLGRVEEPPHPAQIDVAEEQMQRIERQTAVLERSAAMLWHSSPGLEPLAAPEQQQSHA